MSDSETPSWCQTGPWSALVTSSERRERDWHCGLFTFNRRSLCGARQTLFIFTPNTTACLQCSFSLLSQSGVPVNAFVSRNGVNWRSICLYSTRNDFWAFLDLKLSTHAVSFFGSPQPKRSILSSFMPNHTLTSSLRLFCSLQNKLWTPLSFFFFAFFTKTKILIGFISVSENKDYWESSAKATSNNVSFWKWGAPGCCFRGNRADDILFNRPLHAIEAVNTRGGRAQRWGRSSVLVTVRPGQTMSFQTNESKKYIP